MAFASDVLYMTLKLWLPKWGFELWSFSNGLFHCLVATILWFIFGTSKREKKVKHGKIFKHKQQSKISLTLNKYHSSTENWSFWSQFAFFFILFLLVVLYKWILSSWFFFLPFCKPFFGRLFLLLHTCWELLYTCIL